MRAEQTFASIVKEYNERHAPERVEIVRGGDEFSSLKEVIASRLAGIVPDVVAVECSEIPALERAGIKPAGKAEPRPFLRTVPLLFVDQEMVFRIHGDPLKPPRDWKSLTELARRFAEHFDGSDRVALALPLTGPKGLWLFESLAGAPLWSREAGGLRVSRALLSPIRSLQVVIDRPRVARPEEAWDRAIQAFLDRKSPLLIASTEMLPYIAGKAEFRWTAVPAPRIDGRPGSLVAGSDLIVLKESEGVRKFLAHLYSPEIAARWTAAGGYLPLRKDWQTAAWKTEAARLGPYATLAQAGQTGSPRTGDRDVVRARTVWVHALESLFGDPSRRVSTESLFADVDSRLNSASGP